MSQSRDWTPKLIFDAAYRDVDFDVNNEIYIQRYDLVNYAIELNADVLSPLIGNFLRTKVPFNVPLPTKFLTAATLGTYTAATAIVTSSNMNLVFTANDIERPILFRTGANGNWGYVDGFISGTQVRVRGNSLPTIDLTLDSIEMPATTPVSSSIMLSQLRIQRVGGQIKIILESSITNYVEPLSLEEFKVWRSSAQANLSKIVYCVSGDEVLLNKGDNLASLGTLTFYFQRIPSRVAPTQKADFPDGAAMQVVIATLKMVIARRQGNVDKMASFAGEAKAYIDSLYAAAGKASESEVLVQRIKSLI